MLVNRENFLRRLDAVSPGLASRETIEQSSCFVLKDGLVTTYDEEVCCRGSSLLDSSFHGAVASKPLLEILRKTVDEVIDVTIRDGSLLIRAKREEITIRMDKEITLPVEMVEVPEEWLPLHDQFTEAVKVVGGCAGRDESQFAATCIHLHPKWVEAFDNFQACRWRLKTGISESTLVKASSLKNLAHLGMGEFSITPAWVHFRNGDNLTLSCRRYIQDYANLSPLFVGEGVTTALPKGLPEALAKADIFSKEGDCNLVRVELTQGQLILKAESHIGSYKRKMKAGYSGEPLSFVVPPAILASVVQRHQECQLLKDRLMVNGGPYVYTTTLTVQEGEDGKEVEDDGDR